MWLGPAAAIEIQLSVSIPADMVRIDIGASELVRKVLQESQLSAQLS